MIRNDPSFALPIVSRPRALEVQGCIRSVTEAISVIDKLERSLDSYPILFTTPEDDPRPAVWDAKASLNEALRTLMLGGLR